MNIFNLALKFQEYEWEKRQIIETLLNEEALLFASFLRNERKNWIPRTPSFDF